MAKKGYIYKYTYPNGMLYIGATSVSVKQAHYQHMSASKDPSRWTLCEMAIFEYGEPTIEIIETIEVADNEEGKLKELLKKSTEKWIKEYDSTVESGKGFNNFKGRRVSWIDYLLRKKWDEIYDEEKRDEELETLVDTLESIGTKKCITKEKLTKEEERVWYRCKFKEYDYFSEEEVGYTTFSSFYKRHLAENEDWGDVPYETIEIMQNKNASAEKINWANQTQNKIFFDNTIKDAVENNWCRYVSEMIWEKVKKEEKELWKIKERMDKKEEIRRQKIGLKASFRAIARYHSNK